MKRIKYVILIVLSLLYVSSNAVAQVLTYNVVKGKKTIGKMTVEQLSFDDTTRYVIQSTVEFNLILTFKIEFNADETFKSGVLIEGQSESMLNGRTQKKSIVKGDGEKYVVNLNGSAKTISNKGIELSIPHLYFIEPKTSSKVFSQQFADFIPIEDMGNGVYELSSPDGKNVYSYENNVCVEVRVYRTYANFSFKLVR